MKKLSRSQTSALALLLVVTGFICFAVIYPYWAFQQHKTQDAESRRHQLGIYRALAAQQDQFDSQLKALQEGNLSSSFYLSAKTSALATAQMQKQIKQLATNSKSELISTQILNNNGNSPTDRAGLRVNMRMDANALLQVMYTLETGKPMYFIDNILIDARPARTRTGTGIVETTQLDVKFDVHGYLMETS